MIPGTGSAASWASTLAVSLRYAAPELAMLLLLLHAPWPAQVPLGLPKAGSAPNIVAAAAWSCWLLVLLSSRPGAYCW
jgi:hypothetical protein